MTTIDTLHPDWCRDDTSIVREFSFKGYARAVQLVNLCAWVADQEGHHPDISFGWGYVTVRLTTHDDSGLTPKDFGWARRLDAILDSHGDT